MKERLILYKKLNIFYISAVKCRQYKPNKDDQV